MEAEQPGAADDYAGAASDDISPGSSDDVPRASSIDLHRGPGEDAEATDADEEGEAAAVDAAAANDDAQAAADEDEDDDDDDDDDDDHYDYGDDLGGLSEDNVGGRRNALPRRVESWRTRSASGAIATALAMGLQQVFEPEKRRPAAVAEAPSDPYSENDPVTVDYTPDDAEATTVHVKPWLLQKDDPA